jgi:hypothetical protein
MEEGERRQRGNAGRRERGMVGGEEAAGNRWTQGAWHGGRRRGGSGETAERRERGMEGGEQAAGKPLDAVGARGAQEQ